jgi:nicotinate-nucleotide pyrophosphorylase (carboxylating)
MNVNTYIRRALAEDIGGQDITSNSLISPRSVSEARVIVKENAILCGMSLAQASFKQLDPHIIFRQLYRDGQRAPKNTIIAKIKGRTRALLSAERVALNFLGQLSGIATLTNLFVQKVQGTRAAIYDTRKTTPGLRELEKYAVRCGGGKNHRASLNEMILIKDNHRMCVHPEISMEQAVQKIRKRTRATIAVEADNITQFKQALGAAPDIILMDNMTPARMRRCVQLLKGPVKNRPQLEASGGIHLKNARAIARSGVDRISIGALTHSAPAIDVSLEITRSWDS